MKFIAILGLLALTACGTYVVRLYDYHGAAERGEAPAERGEAPAEAPAERGDKGDKGDKGDDGEGKGSGTGEKGSGKSHGGKDKGKDGDDD